MLPTSPDFPSEPTAGSAGRLYRIDRRLSLVAYWIPDCETFKGIGASEGFAIYSFVKGGKSGGWHWTHEPDRLIEIMTAYRNTQDPLYRPERLEAPDGSDPDIRPAFVGVLQKAMEDALPKELRPRREPGLTVIDGDG